MLAGLGSAVLLVVAAATGVGGLFGVAVPLWLVLASAGLGLPNAPALALSRHGESAGTAAAMLGAVQFGVGAAVSPVVGLLGNDALALGVVVLAASVLAVVVLFAVVRPRSLPDVDEAPGEAGAEVPGAIAR